MIVHKTGTGTGMGEDLAAVQMFSDDGQIGWMLRGNPVQ